jgi:hypothetical protein
MTSARGGHYLALSHAASDWGYILSAGTNDDPAALVTVAEIPLSLIHHLPDPADDANISSLRNWASLTRSSKPPA